MKRSFYKVVCIVFIVFIQITRVQAQKNCEKGDRYFDQNLFDMASKYYQMDLRSKNKKIAEYAAQKLANCYRISGEFEKAEETFKKILKRKKKEPLNYLNYGLALKNSAKYAEAAVQFQEYIKLNPIDPMGPIYLLSCDSAQKWLEETIGKEVNNLEKINSELSEFSPVFYKENELCFSSSRQGSKKAFISLDGGGDIHRLDLYTIKIQDLESKDKGKTALINFDKINTPLHEGSGSFSADGTELYFTKTIKGKRDKQTNKILGTLQIYYSKQDTSGNWSKPLSAFSFNSIHYSVGHPSLSKDGKTIFFMSDKPGGFGKTDIYYSTKNEAGKWSDPVNAGPNVNKFGYELFPTISESDELYFSSNSHPGMGQLDIFKAEFNNGQWGNIQNLKPPINSIANDFGVAFDGTHKRGFFSSDRFNGKGAEDIYSFSDDETLEMDLVENSLSFDDKYIFDGLKFSIKNNNDSTEETLLPANGKYSIKIDTNLKCELIVSKNGLPFNRISIAYEKKGSEGDYELIMKPESKAIVVKPKYNQMQTEDNDSSSLKGKQVTLYKLNLRGVNTQDNNMVYYIEP